MAPLNGEDESWFNGEQQTKTTESISVRVSNKSQEMSKRQPTGAAEEPESDGEDDKIGCCFFRGRSKSRKLYSSGTPFARLDSEDPGSKKAKVKLQRSRFSCATIFFCCGPRGQSNYTTVEVRAVDITKQDSKWEVHLNEEHCKPTYWKQLVRKVKAHAHSRQAHSSRCEWLNYDSLSYQMNFDDGCWRENCVSSLFANEDDDSASQAGSMQSAILKKFATSRTRHGSPGNSTSPCLSPLPVKVMSKEEIQKSKDGVVPIWQRRQGAPPIKLDLRQRPGPMD